MYLLALFFCLSILALLIIILDVFVDHYMITTGVYIRHTLSLLLPMVMIGVISGWLYYGTGSWQAVIGLIILYPSMRWIYHDFFLNILRGLKWNYLPSKDSPTLAKTDQFLIWIKNKWDIEPLFVRLSAFALSVATFFIFNLAYETV